MFLIQCWWFSICIDCSSIWGQILVYSLMVCWYLFGSRTQPAKPSNKHVFTNKLIMFMIFFATTLALMFNELWHRFSLYLLRYFFWWFERSKFHRCWSNMAPRMVTYPDPVPLRFFFEGPLANFGALFATCWALCIPFYFHFEKIQSKYSRSVPEAVKHLQDNCKHAGRKNSTSPRPRAEHCRRHFDYWICLWT